MSSEPEPAKPEPADSAGIPGLLRRVHEHKMVQWTIGYVALAYGIQHAVILTSESFEWPSAVARITMLLLVFGLPLAITVAWYQGARASRNFSQAELSILSALLAIGALLFYVFVQPAQEPAGPELSQVSIAGAPTVQSGVAAARQASLSPTTAISLAVMPFENLSPDPSQGYFVDGMADEIITALAKIPDLRVVGRESALQFKGKHENFRYVGQALNATHLLEGSVRKAGDQLRISAELVRADTGITIWANSYDRKLDDVFAIQEDIARAIATSLHMTLGLKPGENLVNARTNQSAYDSYLSARALIRARTFDNASQAVKLLEGVTTRDPDFAPGWGMLGHAYAPMPLFDPVRQSGDTARARVRVSEFMTKAEAAANRALQLDPNAADPYQALAQVERARHQYAKAFDFFDRGIALDPDNTDVLTGKMTTLAALGHLDEAVAIGQRLVMIEPYVPVYAIDRAVILWAAGQTEPAITAMRSFPRGGNADAFLAMFYASQGHYAEAADLLESIRSDAIVSRDQRKVMAELLRQAPKPTARPNELPRFGVVEWVYLTVGATGRVLDYEESNLKAGFLGNFEVWPLWSPFYAPVRKTERFKNFVRDAGMVDYWRAKGWPAQCHPTTGNDFACE